MISLTNWWENNQDWVKDMLFAAFVCIMVICFAGIVVAVIIGIFDNSECKKEAIACYNVMTICTKGCYQYYIQTDCKMNKDLIEREVCLDG